MAEIGVQRLELCSPLGYGADFAALSNGKTYRHFYRERITKGSEIPPWAWPWAVLFGAC